jgi:hypothetical protein
LPPQPALDEKVAPDQRIARTGPGGAHQTVLDQDRVRQLSAPGFRPATVTVRASEVTHVRLDRAG